MFGYDIPNEIIGPVIGVMGAFIVAILTLLVYHIPFFVSIRVKAEVKQRIKAENALEVFKALGSFFHAVSNVQSSIILLADMLLIRLDSRKIGEGNFQKLENVAKKLNSTENVRQMLSIANNEIIEHVNVLTELMNNILSLFKMDRVISKKDGIPQEILGKIFYISSELRDVFRFDTNSQKEDIITLIQEVIKKHSPKIHYEGEPECTDLEEEIQKITEELMEIYKKNIT